MTDVVTAGEALGCLRADGRVLLGGTARLSVAGAEANVAIGLARLGHDVRYAGAVGDDQFGALIRRTFRAEGVGTGFLRTDTSAPTGIILFEERLSGVMRVDYHRVASAGSHLGSGDVLAALDGSPTPPAVFHVTGVTMALGPGPRAAVLAGVRHARELGVRVCLDVNHRTRLWTAAEARRAFLELTSDLDIVIASDDELTLVAPGDDEAGRVSSLLDLGVREVVVKHGDKGATAYTPDGSVHRDAVPVTAVDTIGAGDAFVAGYLSGLLDGLDVDRRLRRGVTLGAFAVATRGDWEGLPYRSELGLADVPSGEAVR
ncbi:sugar kinase [Streptosporangium sp. NPDC004631]